MQITMQPQGMHGNLCVEDHRCIMCARKIVCSSIGIHAGHDYYSCMVYCFFSFSRVSKCVHYFVFLMSSPHVIACYLLNLCASLTYMRQ